MCDGGVAIWIRSRLVSCSASRQCRTASSNAAWVCRTAFGRPVVPELNTSTASAVRRPASRRGSAREVIGSSRCSIGIKPGQHRMVADGVGRVGERQRVVDLVVLPRGADQHRRRAQPPDRQQGGDELRPVGRHDRDPLTCGEHPFCQGRGQPVGQRVELGQAELPLLEHERGRLGHVPSFPGRAG